MSAVKARKARATTPKAAAETIPLADLTITWRRRHRYITDPEDGADLTITGAQLAAVLGALAEEEPQGEWDSLGDPKDVAEQLESINEVLFVLASHVDHYESSEALYVITRYLRSLEAPLRGYREREAILKHATVTISRKPTEVA